jgi:hypothetical protein
VAVSAKKASDLRSDCGGPLTLTRSRFSAPIAAGLFRCRGLVFPTVGRLLVGAGCRRHRTWLTIVALHAVVVTIYDAFK